MSKSKSKRQTSIKLKPDDDAWPKMEGKQLPRGTTVSLDISWIYWMQFGKRFVEF